MITDVTKDAAYRQLAEQALRSAGSAVNIQVASVQFGHDNDDANRSWLCLVVDPNTDDHMAADTASTAVDHLQLLDPGGILRAAGSEVDVTITDVEVADEASLTVRGEDGQPRLTSPWQKNLAVARVRFGYRPTSK